KQRGSSREVDELEKLKKAPNGLGQLRAGAGIGQDARVGQFATSDPHTYIAAIEHFAAALATITRTPKHIFFKQQGAISGEALLTMESPLTRKVNKRIDRFTPEWRDAFTFLMQLRRHPIKSSDIKPIFQPSATVQPFTQAQTRSMNKSAGIPIVTQLRREGWTQAEINQLTTDVEQEIGALTIPDAANQ
ncbi:MAG: hypothetical protein GY952_11490, partial [Rhodobacteraceae bacterium]|nr:hypothetical protein [Paracoccaceae bacterium]